MNPVSLGTSVTQVYRNAEQARAETQFGTPISPSAQTSLGFISECVVGLDRALGELREKLGPVLTPVPAGEAWKEDGSPGPSVSPVVAFLDAEARRIQALTAAVRALTERVEL